MVIAMLLAVLTDVCRVVVGGWCASSRPAASVKPLVGRRVYSEFVAYASPPHPQVAGHSWCAIESEWFDIRIF